VLTTFAVAFGLIVTGLGPHEKRMSPPGADRGDDRGRSAASRRPGPLSCGDKLIQDVGQSAEVRQLTRRRRVAPLTQAVDPHRADAERVGGRDVVVMALRHVHVPRGIRAG
jgi:hypothetical protein